MNYSCAYWEEADTLDEAQEAKLELTCRKLAGAGHAGAGYRLRMGRFALYAAEKYGVEVTGITVSGEQVKLAQRCCEGLPVCFELQDYRDIQGTFDRIVSIGMFEHVGFTNYRTYMQVVNRCLKDDGLFLLHTIGSNTSVRSVDPWIAKYIFPNSMLPSARQITAAAEGLFVLEDWHSFGPHYDPTLMAWHRNFSITGTVSRMPTTSGFIACGFTTCFPAPAVSGRGETSSGRSFFQELWVTLETNAGVNPPFSYPSCPIGGSGKVS